MHDPVVSELAEYFKNRVPLAASDLVRLAALARAAGWEWPAIARACGPAAGDAPGEGSAAAAWRVFRDIQNAAAAAAGSRLRLAPLLWPCPDCGREVTDVAPVGRPVHVECGHGQGCPRLGRDQARDEERRRSWVPSLVDGSQAARGPLQRHRLTRRFTDWCPRCGWYGYFDDWAATIGGDWAWLVCDNCWADLDPGMTVRVNYYTASAGPRGPGSAGPFGVIRQRARSDRGLADSGQVLTWEPFWQWTSLLADSGRGADDAEVVQVSRDEAEQAVSSLVRRRWASGVLGLPWVASSYPDGWLPGWPGPA